MGRRISILSIVISGFAAATAAAAALALFQLAPDGSAPQLLPLAQPHLDRAFAQLRGPHGRDRAVLAQAEAETRQALATSPARADAWLTIAYIEHEKAGGFGPKAADALNRSYLVGPLDPDVSLWRLEFAFDNWPALSKELKGDVLRELSAMWTRTDRRQPLRELVPTITDPSGRLALRVQIALAEHADQEAAAESN
jgi:hypothetical protein